MASIQKKGNVFHVVYDYQDDNKRKQKWEPCASMEEAEIRKAEIELDKARNKLIIPTTITVAEFFEKWLPGHARKKWSFTTYSGYTALIKNHILYHIGDMALQKLTTEHIDTLYDTLRQKEKRTGGYCQDKFFNEKQAKIASGVQVKKKGTLSTTTIKEVHDILRIALCKAEEWKYIRENPIPKEAPKKNKDFEQSIWSKNIMDKALQEIEDPILHIAVHCAFIGSLRNGETIGITLDCVELDYKDSDENLIGRILINKTLQRVSKEALNVLPNDSLIYQFPNVLVEKKSCIILKDPKTPKSKRYMFLNAQLRKEIAQQIERINRNKDIYGERYNDHNLLICLPNGNPIEPKLLEKWFLNWQAKSKSGFPPLIFHGIRHSSATYKSGISFGDMNLLQKEGGWGTADMASHYTHVNDSDRINLSKKMESDFYSKAPSNSVTLNPMNALIEQMQNDPELQKKVFNALFAQKA